MCCLTDTNCKEYRRTNVSCGEVVRGELKQIRIFQVLDFPDIIQKNSLITQRSKCHWEPVDIFPTNPNLRIQYNTQTTSHITSLMLTAVPTLLLISVFSLVQKADRQFCIKKLVRIWVSNVYCVALQWKWLIEWRWFY